MDRYYENDNRQRKNHYADFDEHGNPLTGNRNSLSRRNPEGNYGSGMYERDDRRRGEYTTHSARAYGDMSHGTRYGEGGSYEGGGSAYGHSYYGLSGQQGPRIAQHDRGWSESRQYDAYGDSRHYQNRDQRFSDSFGRSSDGGYINEGRRDDNRHRNHPGHYDDSYQGYRSSGYDRGYEDFRGTGYGSTEYDNRDRDRMRSLRGNRDSDWEGEHTYTAHNRFNSGQDW